jgi:hypothetical protein
LIGDKKLDPVVMAEDAKKIERHSIIRSKYESLILIFRKSGLVIVGVICLCSIALYAFISLSGDEGIIKNELNKIQTTRSNDTGAAKKGILNGPNGSRYEGEIVDGKAHGKGIEILMDNYRYEGDFSNGQFNGKGTLQSQDGSTYSGDFIKGSLEGTGVLRLASGIQYVGEFLYGKFHGKGIMTSNNGERYEGEFYVGAKRGKGKLTWPAGQYEGDFLYDKASGKGKMTLADGTVQEGDFLDGRIVGLNSNATDNIDVPSITIKKEDNIKNDTLKNDPDKLWKEFKGY